MANTQHNIPCNNSNECGEVCILNIILRELVILVINYSDHYLHMNVMENNIKITMFFFPCHVMVLEFRNAYQLGATDYQVFSPVLLYMLMLHLNETVYYRKYINFCNIDV